MFRDVTAAVLDRVTVVVVERIWFHPQPMYDVVQQLQVYTHTVTGRRCTATVGCEVGELPVRCERAGEQSGTALDLDS